jgi:hypothetical protein
MSQATVAQEIREFRTLPKDIGVALVVVAALALGLLLRVSLEGRTTTFQDKNSPFSISYPATWSNVAAKKNLLLDVEDPRSAGAFKTTLEVDARGLDLSSPPTLQQLVDRRVQENSKLTAYHLIATSDDSVGGAKANRVEYAYVVQPIDQARRASLPVVVHAVDYVVVTKDNVYYITLAAPEEEFADASAQLNQMIRTVKVQ